MLKFIRGLAHLGTHKNYSDKLNEKIKICNSINLVLSLSAIGYILIAWFLIPVTLPILLISLFFAGLSFLLNYLGATKFARLIVCINPLQVSFFIHIMLLRQGEEMVNGIIITTVCFWIIPWLLFDIQDFLLLIITGIVSFLSVILVPYSNSLIETDFDTSLIRSSFFEFVFALTGLFILAAGMYVMKRAVLSHERKALLLITRLQERENQLKTSEDILNKNIQQLKSSQNTEKIRNWEAQGLANFAQILRNNQNIRQMGKILISQLVKYLNAQHGTFFISKVNNENEEILELIAGYAFGKEGFEQKTMIAGEGLTGQAYVSKKIIQLNKIPENYLYKISSGLGESAPRSLVFVPLNNGDVSEGVIEIASFNKFEQYQLEFLEKLAESIAVTLQVAKKNEITQKLLMESQDQTEMLKAQEELMIQNLEELMASQEQQTKLQEELLNKEKEIENMFLELEKLKKAKSV